MRLKPKPPFNFNLTATLMYLMPPAKYSEGRLSRILRLRSGKLVCISITANDKVEDPELFISLKPEVSEDEEREIKNKVSFMFSIEDDLSEFYPIAKRDSVLRWTIEDLYGLKIQTAPTLFEGLVIGFCLQWVSFARGVQMMDCLIKRYGEQVNDYYAFPAPEALAKASIEELKECKLGFRAERIKWISERVTKGLDLEKLKALPDKQLKEELMKIKWVGEWTAEALLLWRFKRYNSFPLDVWSAKIFQAFYPQLKNQSLNDIAKFAAMSWGNYQGLAYYYLMCDRKNIVQKLNVELVEKWN
jgi:N-glycosylase/DNA lyase